MYCTNQLKVTNIYIKMSSTTFHINKSLKSDNKKVSNNIPLYFLGIFFAFFFLSSKPLNLIKLSETDIYKTNLIKTLYKTATIGHRIQVTLQFNLKYKLISYRIINFCTLLTGRIPIIFLYIKLFIIFHKVQCSYFAYNQNIIFNYEIPKFITQKCRAKNCFFFIRKTTSNTYLQIVYNSKKIP